MKCVPVSALFVLFVLSPLFSPPAHAQGTGPSFDALRGVYERQKGAFEKTLETKLAEASARYLSDLRALAKHMEKTGDDFGVRPVNAEILRFQTEKTVPKNSPIGTPELLKQARARYYETLATAEEDRNGQTRKLTQQYVEHLTALRERCLARSATVDAARLAEEIERISSSGGDTEAPVAGVEIRLPRRLLSGLRLAYTFEGMAGRRVRDLSGGRRHGEVMGAKTQTIAAEGVVCEFKGEYDVLELQPVRLNAIWTISARVRFPLARAKRPRVLTSGGFGEDHVVVDEQGILGTGAGSFAASQFNVGDLRGWHDVTAVCNYSRTVFYLDGKAVGVVKATCREPLKVIGNSEAGGRPWSGAVSSIMVWSRSLSSAEVEALVKSLHSPAIDGSK